MLCLAWLRRRTPRPTMTWRRWRRRRKVPTAKRIGASEKSIPIDIVFYIIFRQYLYAVPFSWSGPVGENVSWLHSDRDHKSHPLPPPPLPISNHFLPFLPACLESLLPLFSLSTPKPADKLRNDYWSGEGAAKERKKRTEGKAVSIPGPFVSPPSPSLFLAGGRAFSFERGGGRRLCWPAWRHAM